MPLSLSHLTGIRNRDRYIGNMMGLLYYSTLKLSPFISIIPALFTDLLAIPHKWKTFLSHKPNVLAGGSHGTDEYKRPSRFVLSLAPSAPHIGLSIAPTSLDIREYKPRQRGIIVPRSPRWIGKSPYSHSPSHHRHPALTGFRKWADMLTAH